MGAGSNILIRDGGFDGAIIKLRKKLSLTSLSLMKQQLYLVPLAV